MSSNACAISVVEAAYQISRSDEAWIQGVLHALRPALDRGAGLIGGIYDVSDPSRIRIRSAHGVGARPELVDALSWLSEHTPIELARIVFSTKPFATTGEKLRKHGGSAGALGPLARYGITDMIDLNAQNPNKRGVMIGAPLLGPARLTLAETKRGERLAAHIAAAFRLREQLGHEQDPTAGADAILRPDARLEHAGGEAKFETNRTALRTAADALDRARGKLRQQDPDEALGLWRALVCGRWTLFDHYESDGRRVLIARRNDPETAPLSHPLRRALQVLAYRAMGHSLKFISYELGLSTSTVHRELKRGMAAFGIHSSVELAQLVRKDKPIAERTAP